MRQQIVYGLDIETDRATDPLDPMVARVTKVALAGPGFEEQFTGPETDLLRAVDGRLRGLPGGILATWKGSTFDLPFLGDRAGRNGVVVGLRLRHDDTLLPTQAPLPGHLGAYRASWWEHRHIDACRLCNGEPTGRRWSVRLRAAAELVGLRPATVVADGRVPDRDAVHAHAPNDARLARALVLRRLPLSARLLDHVDPLEPAASLRLVPAASVPAPAHLDAPLGPPAAASA